MGSFPLVSLKGTQARLVVLAIALLFPITAIGQQESGKRLSREESVNAIDALATWFECEECHPAQLIAVTRYGQIVVPSLVASLNGGLSPASRELLRRFLDARYTELTEQGENDPRLKITSSRNDFVARHLEDFDARYRIRAAQALVAIGGAEARKALEAALSKAERADVRTVIQQSLERIR
jgi:hypothetical protein